MISRAIHKNQKGRRWLTALAIVGLISGTFFVGNAVLASTPANVFELEGNATSQTVDDWDHVCHQVLTTDCSTSSNTSGATAVAWAEDVHGAVGDLGACSGTNCTIFTGGGSKDPSDINSWAWKDNVGGLPDKDNLLHGFAARYSITPSASCTVPPTAPAGTKCELLMFGNDRFDNSGDAQQGFWFFQNKIGLGSNTVGGGNGFSSSGGTEFHRNGDLLLISDFSNGGGVSTITVYTWDTGCTATNIPKTGPVSGVSCGDANLRFQASSDQANCGAPNNVNPAISGFCGIVNPADGTVSPWPFVDKTTIGATHPANTFLQGELYEGGVNLSFLNLAGECFASVASETRSSQSTTATLKDFVLGSFGDCSSHITTTPGDSTGTALTDHSSPVNGVPDVSIGTGSVQVRDHAVVTVSGVNLWSGSVSFKLCGPLAFTPTTSNCATSGVSIPFTGGATGAVSNTSTAVNSGLATLTRAGRYCWQATFTSGTTGVPNSTDPSASSTSTTECFEVLPVQPTLSTQVVSTSVVLGNPISDNATIAGLATQPGTGGLGDGSINPTTPGVGDAGSITWTVKGPDSCTASGLTVTGSPATINGNGTYGPVSATPTALGQYTFVASFATTNPNNKNIGASACPDTTHTEEVTVTGTSSMITDQDWLPNDTATLTGDANLNGSLTFTLYNDLTCGADSGTAKYTESITVTNAASGSTFATHNGSVVATTFKAIATGNYSWKVSYNDSVLSDPSDSCETTALTINNHH